MSRHTLHTPPVRDGNPRDLVYTEPAVRERGLYLLLQDTSPRPSEARERFLRAAYRRVVDRAFANERPRAAVGVLRDVVRDLDRLAGGVDTRLDDFRGLGIHVLMREGDRHFLLCTRGSSVRVRENGIFVALAPGATQGVEELDIETARTQHDLFTPTLPESLVLYSIQRRGGKAPLELLMGGDAEDAVAAIDSLDLAREAHATVEVERLRHAVLHVRFEPVDARVHAQSADPAPRRAYPPLRRATWVAAVALVLAAGIGLAVVQPWERAVKGTEPARARVTQQRTTPVETRTAPAPVPEVAKEEAPREKEPDERSVFRVAWENEYRAAVTSSPSALGDAIVFGGRDGSVYAIDRANGERIWSHAAAGGVGASPLVSGNAVIAADYTGLVCRLASSGGKPVWKRALREKVVSTPALGSGRVAVGTVRGNVYALSLETGRVLWKFGTRAQVRGNILHAGDTFYVPSHDGRLYALADDTGSRRWAVSLGGAVASSPAFDGRNVVVGTAGGDVVALDPASGKRAWTFSTRGEVNAAIAAADGRVYAASADRSLYCIDAASGTLVWKAATGGTVLSRPSIAGDRVLVTAYDGLVYCFDADSGELIDRFDTAESIFSSPLVVGDRVYFGNNDGRFYCLLTPRS